MTTVDLIKVNLRWAERMIWIVMIGVVLIILSNVFWFSFYSYRGASRQNLVQLRNHGHRTTGLSIVWSEDVTTPETGTNTIDHLALRFPDMAQHEIACFADGMLVDVQNLTSATKLKGSDAIKVSGHQGTAMSIRIIFLPERTCVATVENFEGNPNLAFSFGLISGLLVLIVNSFAAAFLVPAFLGVGDVDGLGSPYRLVNSKTSR